MMLMEAALLLDLSMLGLDDQVLSWCAEQVILAFTWAPGGHVCSCGCSLRDSDGDGDGDGDCDGDGDSPTFAGHRDLTTHVAALSPALLLE